MAKKRLEVPRASLSITVPKPCEATLRLESEVTGRNISDIITGYIEQCQKVRDSPIGQRTAIESQLELLAVRESKLTSEIGKEAEAQANLESKKLAKIRDKIDFDLSSQIAKARAEAERSLARAEFESNSYLADFSARLEEQKTRQLALEKERLLEKLDQINKDFENSVDAILLKYIKRWKAEEPWESVFGAVASTANLARELTEKHGILAIRKFDGSWAYGLAMAEWIRNICCSKRFVSREQCISAISTLQTFAIEQGVEEFWSVLCNKGYFRTNGQAHIVELKQDYGPVVIGPSLGGELNQIHIKDLLEAIAFVDHAYEGNCLQEFLNISNLEFTNG